MKTFNWYNYSGCSGFGDMITRLSEFYMMHENQDIHVNCYEKLKNWENIDFVRKFVLSQPKNNVIFEYCNEVRQVKNKEYYRYNLEYWPAKKLWKQKKTKKIAHWFSTKMVTWRHGFNTGLIDQYKAKNFDKVNNLKKIFTDYEFIELYDISKNRGDFEVIVDKKVCIEKNMEILSDCELFIASEGGWTHVSRSMKVPTILHFNHHDKENLKKIYERFEIVLNANAGIALGERQMIKQMSNFLS